MLTDAGPGNAVLYQCTLNDYAASLFPPVWARLCDSVGGATFMKGLDCLKPCGMMVSFGQSSGAVEAFDILSLSAKRSL